MNPSPWAESLALTLADVSGSGQSTLQARRCVCEGVWAMTERVSVSLSNPPPGDDSHSL